MEGVNLTPLDLGFPDGTSEVFVSATYVGYPGGTREEEWLVRTYSGWTMPLTEIERRHPAIGAKIRAKIIEATRGL